MLPPPQVCRGMPADMLKSSPATIPTVAKNRADAAASMEKYSAWAGQRHELRYRRATSRPIATGGHTGSTNEEIYIDGESTRSTRRNGSPVMRGALHRRAHLTGDGLDAQPDAFYENFTCARRGN